ncbi:MAG: hypothetical protein JRJ38_10560 [Deltaproteobacteria bacterium]|nr:hypothetical protein [Deltaproteobacteria bacterium]
MNEQIVLGFLGGLIFDFLQLLELQKKPKENRPDFKDWLYWLPHFVWPFLGALLVYVCDTPNLKLSKLLSLQLGLSAPLMFRQMIQSNPLALKKIELQDENQ